MVSADELLGEVLAFPLGQQPAGDIAAVDVEDDVERVGGAFDGTPQLGDVPGPDLVGGGGDQFGPLIVGMAELVAPFTDLVVAVQDAVEGADRAKVESLVEQGGIDLCG